MKYTKLPLLWGMISGFFSILSLLSEECLVESPGLPSLRHRSLSAVTTANTNNTTDPTAPRTIAMRGDNCCSMDVDAETIHTYLHSLHGGLHFLIRQNEQNTFPIEQRTIAMCGNNCWSLDDGGTSDGSWSNELIVAFNDDAPMVGGQYWDRD